MQEYFDIVDEHDKIIGKAPRKECHRNPRLVHRGVFIIVLNSKGQMLLAQRSMKKDTNPGRWEVIGEHNKLGESYENAAKRGLQEELGMSARVRRISKLKLSSKREAEFDGIFVANIKSKQKINFDKEEINEIRFISIGKLRKEIGESDAFGVKLLRRFVQMEIESLFHKNTSGYVINSLYTFVYKIYTCYSVYLHLNLE